MLLSRGNVGRPTAAKAHPLTTSTRHRLLRLLACAILLVVCITISALVFRFLLVPVLVACSPILDIYFYDLGVYGINPERHYRSFHLTSEVVRSPRWDSDVCDCERDEGGLVLVDVHGTGVSHSGPRIVDLQGNLVWTNDSFGEHAMNARIQSWKGAYYITFWAGLGDKGQYYMLDSGYNLVKTVQAVGDGFEGDPHEFIITADDTALIIVYDCHEIDVSSTHMTGMQSNIVDAIIQEIDLETGALLFEWRASDHFTDGEYLKYSYDLSPAMIPAQPECTAASGREPADYFHLNSVSKDAQGNYLVSVRKTHQILCISHSTGQILWGFGGRASDFEDLEASNPEAECNFKWQHDARWLDEGAGILSMFDNGVSENDRSGNPHSMGRIIELDVENRTARQLHSYKSLKGIRTASQGSFQYLPGTASSRDWPNAGSTASQRDQAFIGWGLGAAFSLHDAETERVLCETHYTPALFFPLGLTKTYRAIRAPKGLKFRPEQWDPVAVASRGNVYISWNGGMEVRAWQLKGMNNLEQWEDIMTVPRSGFETVFSLPVDSRYSAYTVAALDDDENVLRHSNVFEHSSPGVPVWEVLLIGSAAAVVLVMGYAYVREWRRHTRRGLRLADVFSLGSGRPAEYKRLKTVEELDDFRQVEEG